MRSSFAYNLQKISKLFYTLSTFCQLYNQLKMFKTITFFVLLSAVVHSQILNVSHKGQSTGPTPSIPTPQHETQAESPSLKSPHINTENRGFRGKNSKQSRIEEVRNKINASIREKYSKLNITTIQQEIKKDLASPAQNASNNTSQDSNHSKQAIPNLSEAKVNKTIDNISQQVKSHLEIVQKKLAQDYGKADKYLKSLNQSNSTSTPAQKSALENISALKKKYQHPRHPKNHTDTKSNKNQTLLSKQGHPNRKWAPKDSLKLLPYSQRIDISCKSDKECQHKFPEVEKLGLTVKCNSKNSKCYAS